METIDRSFQIVSPSDVLCLSDCPVNLPLQEARSVGYVAMDNHTECVKCSDF